MEGTPWNEVEKLLMQTMEMVEGFIEANRRSRSSQSPIPSAGSFSNVLVNNSLGEVMDDETSIGENDELTEPILAPSTSINQVLGVQSESKNGEAEVLCRMTISVETGLQLSHPNYIMEGEYSSTSFSRNEVRFSFFNPFSFEAGKLLNAKNFQPTMLEIGSVEVTHQLFDKMPQPDVDPQKFEPESISWNIFCGIIDLNGVNRVFDVIPGKPDVELWVGKMLLFTFDPGGSSWLDKGCAAFNKRSDAFKFNNDRQHHDPSSAIMACSVVGFFRFGRVMLFVLFNLCIGADSGTVVEVMVVYFGRFLLSITTYECLAKALVIWNDMVVYTWRDIVAVVNILKVAKSLNKSTVSGHYLLVSGSLTECYRKMNLRYPFPAIQMKLRKHFLAGTLKWYQEAVDILRVVSASYRMGTRYQSFIYDATWFMFIFSKSLLSIAPSIVVVGIISQVYIYKDNVDAGLDKDELGLIMKTGTRDTIHVKLAQKIAVAIHVNIHFLPTSLRTRMILRGMERRGSLGNIVLVIMRYERCVLG